jgi:phage shock protein E
MGTVTPWILPPPEDNHGSARCSGFFKKKTAATSISGCAATREAAMFFKNNGCKNIGPEELNEKKRAGEKFLLLDVRTPQENAAQAIEGSVLIPLQDLGNRIQDLPKDREIVVYCRTGSRSAFACAHLAGMGYNVRNLEGGIMVWNRAGNVSVAGVSR